MTAISTQETIIDTPHVQLPWMAKFISTVSNGANPEAKTTIAGIHTTGFDTHFMFIHQFQEGHSISWRAIGISVVQFSDIVLQPQNLFYYELNSSEECPRQDFDLSIPYSQKQIPFSALRQYIESPFSEGLSLVRSLGIRRTDPMGFKFGMAGVIHATTSFSQNLGLRDKLLRQAGGNPEKFQELLMQIDQKL